MALPAGTLTAICEVLAGGAIFVIVLLGIWDARTRRLPNALTFALAALGFAHAAVMSLEAKDLIYISGAAIWAVATMIVLISSEILWRRIKGDAGMGMGDIKMIAALASWLGDGVLFVVAAACIMAVIVEMIRGKKDFPFGPYLSICALIYIGLW